MSRKVRARIADMIGRGYSVPEVARRLKIDPKTVRKYSPAKAADPEPVAPAETVADEPAPDPVKIAEEAHARRRELLLEREAIRDVAGERSFRAYLEPILRSVAPRLQPPPPFRPVRPAPDATEETLLILLSDWHAFEQVKPERLLGLNK